MVFPLLRFPVMRVRVLPPLCSPSVFNFFSLRSIAPDGRPLVGGIDLLLYCKRHLLTASRLVLSLYSLRLYRRNRITQRASGGYFFLARGTPFFLGFFFAVFFGLFMLCFMLPPPSFPFGVSRPLSVPKPGNASFFQQSFFPTFLLYLLLCPHKDCACLCFFNRLSPAYF